MIYKHEIPDSSRLYFSNSAKLKRVIETKASDIFDRLGFEEIVTPFFSYHQHSEIDEKLLIRFSDNSNNLISMRADSTMDVVRLITKRLGRSVDQKKWFYIQPVFRYPSSEQYQIGAEYLENCFVNETINDVLKIIDALNLKPKLQISNMKIPQILSQELDIDIEIFESANLQEIFKLELPWLNSLAAMQDISDLDTIIDLLPNYLRDELLKIKELYVNIDYKDTIISPLYYSNMRYYDGLFFRLFRDNRLFGMGGAYRYEDIDATGFALYTDNLIEEMIGEYEQ